MTVTADRPVNGSVKFDAAAIDELYRSDRDRLLRIASRVAPNRDAGEDAVQEAFVRLLDDPNPVRVTGAFVTAHAKYRALDESRQRGRQKPAGDAIDRLADAPTASGEDDTAAPCMGDPKVAATVEAALKNLDKDDRRAVRLHYLDGLSVSAIAKQLGVSTTTVYARINRGMTKLRELGVRLDEPTLEDLAATLTREIGEKRIGVDNAELVLRRAYGSVARNRANEAKNLHNSRLPSDAPAAVVPPAQPAELPDGLRARLDEVTAVLAEAAAGRRVSYRDVTEILTERGMPRTSKVLAAAQRVHNESLPESAPTYSPLAVGRYTSPPPAEHKPSTAAAVRQRKPCIVRRAAFLRATYGATPPADLPGVGKLAQVHGWDPATASYARAAYIEGVDLEAPVRPETKRRTRTTVASAEPDTSTTADTAGKDPQPHVPTVAVVDLPSPAADAEPAGGQPPKVAEAWLSWADTQVTCMFVHTDESTTRHPVTFRSMPAAQREVTGLLIGQGYRPDGPWTEDTAEQSESMRRFVAASSSRKDR